MLKAEPTRALEMAIRSRQTCPDRFDHSISQDGFRNPENFRRDAFSSVAARLACWCARPELADTP